MRTTIDIPDPMLRQVKAKCALEGRTMRSLTVAFFADWLADGPASATLLAPARPVADDETGLMIAREPGSGEEISAKKRSIRDLPMIGMWKDREDMADPRAWIEKMRGERTKRFFS